MNKDSIYVGNIVQRIKYKENANEIIECTILKENAVLYKNNDGLFVDIEEVKFNKNKVVFMRDYPISDLDYNKSLYGLFIDSESLINYTDFTNLGKKEKYYKI